MKSLLLPPLSTLYGAITGTRNSLYDRGTLKTKRLDRPVISVGNLTVGGTGKTPMVEWVARVLATDGKKVCILTRGYGRQNPRERVLVSDGQNVVASANDAGDEPFLLATNLAGIAAVICDPDRYAAGVGAIKHLKTDCFILDDGFQHRQLARDLDLLLIDSTNPWGGGSLLPYGLLREPVHGLKRADCIVLTRTDQVTNLASLRNQIDEHSGDRPLFSSLMKTKSISPINQTLGPISKKRTAAFCAVGNPSSFYQQVRQNGFDIVFEKSFRDHHRYSQPEIDLMISEAKHNGADTLITTAKDAVKLASLEVSLPCFVLEIEIEIDNADELRRLILQSSNK
jgi:tetraacyldisaccharide 4'-kinase